MLFHLGIIHVLVGEVRTQQVEETIFSKARGSTRLKRMKEECREFQKYFQEANVQKSRGRVAKAQRRPSSGEADLSSGPIFLECIGVVQ